MVEYVEDQEERVIKDYLGVECNIKDKSGCCLIPTTYELSKSLEYAELVTDASSSRARFKE